MVNHKLYRRWQNKRSFLFGRNDIFASGAPHGALWSDPGSILDRSWMDPGSILDRSWIDPVYFKGRLSKMT